MRPPGLTEGRAPWPCAGRRASMPTRRRRTMNNQLPPRKLPASLGHQEAKPSTHPSILMDYLLLKCNQTQPSFPRPEAATMNHDVKKEVHPSNSHIQESTEDLFVAQSTAWIRTNPHLLQRTKKRQANQHGGSGQNQDQPARLGGRKCIGDGAVGERGPRLVQPTGTEASSPGAHLPPSIRGVG